MDSEIGLPLATYHASLWHWLRAQLDGPLDALRERAFELRRISDEAHVSSAWSAFTLGAQLYVVSLLQGGAEETLAQTREYAARIEPSFPGLEIMLARLHVQCGRTDPARRALAGCARLASVRRSEGWLFVVAAAAELCAFTGDRDAARVLYPLLLPYADRVVGVSDLFVCLGSAARPLGSLAALLDDWDTAAAHFERAARHADALRAPVLQTLIEVERSLAYRAHPDARERTSNQERRAGALSRVKSLGLLALAERLERD